ncbi:hypothetical protein [Thalassotalea sp. PLHSN55]|uniref:hypothetical protein n=1 Tax=Thalassotalea sp. PLHSN55 TaxID=3435888 RepID=UPI003F843EF3
MFLITISTYSNAQAHSRYAVFTLNDKFSALSINKVRMLYRGKVKMLQGEKIELCDWSENNQIRSEFYQALLGKDIAQMNAYWASLSFSGKARPPKVIKDDSINSQLKWLSEKSSRIGYAPIDALPEAANVLFIVTKERH